jgi:ParB/RepB/Spo0J family partition protein
MPASTLPETSPKEEIIHQLGLALCHISEHNTRQPKPKEPGIIELAHSIKTHGQTTAAIVRPHPKNKGEYEIGAGARRRVACEVAGLGTLAAVIRELDDTAFEELILVENLQREDPDPRAEIELIDRLVKRGLHTAEEISAHLGKPQHWAQRRLQFLKVVPELRKIWTTKDQYGDGDITHFTIEMMDLLGTLPPETQRRLAKDYEDNRLDVYELERCTTRPALQTWLDAEILCRLDNAPFDLNDPRFFVKGCGPGCATDSSTIDALFDDFGDKKQCGRCLNSGCFKQRLALFQESKLAELEKEHGKDLPVVSREYYSGPVKIGNRQLRPVHVYKVEAKASPGARKVLVLNGAAGEVKIGYVAKERSSGGGSNGSSGGGAARKLQSPAVRLKERKQILQGKRWALVHEELEKALDASKHTEATENVIDLVAVFGLPFKAEMCYGDMKPWKKFDARLKDGWPVHPTYRPTKALSPVKHREAALWHGVCTVLKSIMKPIGNVGDNPRYEPMMRRIAALIKFPIDERKKEADLKILPPRSWGKVDPHTLEPIKPEKILKLPGRNVPESFATKNEKRALNERAESIARTGGKVKCLFCDYVASPISLRQHWCENAPQKNGAKSAKLTKEQWRDAMDANKKSPHGHGRSLADEQRAVNKEVRKIKTRAQKKRRGLTVAGRERLNAAMKARWAARRADAKKASKK